MTDYSVAHLGDEELRRDLDARFADEQLAIAHLVADIAEFDARGLYKERGFESMHAYCMKVGRLSEDAAFRRLTAARTAHRFPRLFQDLANGDLNLSAVCILAAHLTPENVDECVAAARDRSNAEIRDWLAARWIAKAEAAKPPTRQLEVRLPELALTRVNPVPASPALKLAEAASGPDAPVVDSGPIEFEMRFTISREDHERFRYAQALLSHAIPSGDVAAVFRRAVEAVIRECEKRKFAAKATSGKDPVGTDPLEEKSRAQGHPATGRIPAQVRRAVWVRDGGRCTYVSPAGHRCRERRFLEFDHVEPVARGGPSTVDNLRLRCRAHNQEEANRALGAEFMKRKRKQAAIAEGLRRALPTWKTDAPECRDAGVQGGEQVAKRPPPGTAGVERAAGHEARRG